MIPSQNQNVLNFSIKFCPDITKSQDPTQVACSILQTKDQNGALFEQRQTRTWGTSAQTPQTMLAGTASLEAPQAYLMEALGSLDHVG